MSILDALGYTESIVQLTTQQIELILSLQSMDIELYQNIHTRNYEILLSKKGKGGSRLDLEKWKKRFFTSVK